MKSNARQIASILKPTKRRQKRYLGHKSLSKQTRCQRPIQKRLSEQFRQIVVVCSSENPLLDFFHIEKQTRKRNRGKTKIQQRLMYADAYNTDAHISGRTLRVKANSEMHSFFNTRKSINLNSLTPYSIKVSIKIHKKLRVDGKSTEHVQARFHWCLEQVPWCLLAKSVRLFSKQLLIIIINNCL